MTPRLYDPIYLMEHPHTILMYIERNGSDAIKCEVSSRYDDTCHMLKIIGSQIAYDIDDYNHTWRAWDRYPTPADRAAAPWLSKSE